MAYTEGVSASLSGLIGDVATFAQANGWTLNARRFIGQAGYATQYDMAFLTIPGGGLCVGVGEWLSAQTLYRNIMYLLVMGEYSASATIIDDIPTKASFNNGFTGVWNLNTWPITRYYFFGYGSSLHFIIESAPDIFHHFGFGILDRCASYPGGQYVFGHYADANYLNFPWRFSTSAASGCFFLRQDIEGTVNNWQTNYGQSSGLARCSGKTYNSSLKSIIELTPNDFNAQVILYPMSIHAYSSSGGVYVPGYGTDAIRHIAGFVPNTRYCSIATIVPRQEIVLGSDTWKVFPLAQKNGLRMFASGIEGLALKKVL